MKLRKSELKLSTLVSNLPGTVYRCNVDKDWTMQIISDGCLKLTGYAPADFLNNKITFGELILPEDQSRAWDAVQESLQNNTSYDCECRIKTNTG